MLIVIVEDDDGLRESLSDLLNLYGLKILEFYSAETFLRADITKYVDLLILDQILPGMTGTQLLKHLSTKRILPPALLVGARLTDEDRAAAKKAGALAALDKPLQFSVLQKYIATLGTVPDGPTSNVECQILR
jgi:FixJ family two-component response regulator